MKFQSVTIFVLANTETVSLHKVVEILKKTINDDDIEKIVLVLKSITCPAYAEAVKILNDFKSSKLDIYIQKSSDLPSCLSELPFLVKGSHFITLASDMEMDPYVVSNLISEAKKSPNAVICASKWHKESTVEGYNFFHSIATKTFNKIIALIFLSDAKDPASIFRIYPMNVFNSINFEKTADISYEYTFYSLNKNVEYIEIPTNYKKRTEGKSTFNFFSLSKIAFKCIAVSLRLRYKFIFKK